MAMPSPSDRDRVWLSAVDASGREGRSVVEVEILQ
jgi:hypothetical protein